jgi:hypothetical protein
MQKSGFSTLKRDSLEASRLFFIAMMKLSQVAGGPTITPTFAYRPRSVTEVWESLRRTANCARVKGASARIYSVTDSPWHIPRGMSEPIA